MIPAGAAILLTGIRHSVGLRRPRRGASVMGGEGAASRSKFPVRAPYSFIRDVELRPLGDFAVERATADTHQLGGPGPVAARFQQCFPQQSLFVFLDGK